MKTTSKENTPENELEEREDEFIERECKKAQVQAEMDMLTSKMTQKPDDYFRPKPKIRKSIYPISFYKMPFGKYRGKPLDEVPKDYLLWIKENGILDAPENKNLKSTLIDFKLIKPSS